MIDSSFSVFFFAIPFLTTKVDITVRINVHISITSNTLTFANDKTIPAITGEIRYLALPASDISPLAFEYSSSVSRSETVALYAGSSNDENTAEINTPIHMVVRVTSPFIILINMKSIPRPEKPSPIIIISLLSYLSANAPAGTLNKRVGRNPSKVTSAIPAALPVF